MFDTKLGHILYMMWPPFDAAHSNEYEINQFMWFGVHFVEPVPGENDGVALYISHESVPAALPQGNEPMDWIHCMLVTCRGVHTI